jgi:lysozyme family protein/GH24 family phage-related lysozyme (muramidase)
MVQVLQNTKLSVLRPEYQHLFTNCQLRRTWLDRIDQVSRSLLQNRDRYERVAQVVNPAMPWYMVGLIHYLATNFNWRGHLHNGDLLTGRTVNNPPNRPQKEPFQGWAVGYSWEESAVDALLSARFDRAKSWDMPAGILWYLECYTGMGYRSMGIYSPYLWSGTNWYKKGNYENGFRFNPELGFGQVGAGAVVFYMYYKNLLSPGQNPTPSAAPVNPTPTPANPTPAPTYPTTTTTPTPSGTGKLRINNPSSQGTYLKVTPAQASTLPDNQKVWVNNNTELPLRQSQLVNSHYFVTLNGTFNGLDKWYVFSQHVEVTGLPQQPQPSPAVNPPPPSPAVSPQPVSTPTVAASVPSAPATTPQNNSLYGGASGKVPLPGVELIKKFEGCHLKAYPDPLTGGKPITIGWGTTRKKNGGEWRLGESITQAEADDLLMSQLEKDYLPPMEKIPGWNELNANQQGAILSFAYNLGAHFYGSSNFGTMTRVLKNKEWDKIEATFVMYRNPGSNVEAGLKRRRLAEAKVFLTPVSGGVSNASPAAASVQTFAAPAAASPAPTNGDTNRWVQEKLIQFCILDPPADGKWGGQSKAALAWFQQMKGLSASGEIDQATLTALQNTSELVPLHLGSDFASRLAKYMINKGYYVPRGDKRYSIVYVQSLNENFQLTGNTPDAWDDRRIILEIPNNGVPRIVNHWRATTDPGKVAVQTTKVSGGAAQVAFGQYQAWQHGQHGIGKRSGPYPALVQVGPVDIVRDTNRNFRRDDGDTLVRQSVGNGINQHHGWGAGNVGHNSHGCLVGKDIKGHEEFIAMCKQDLRYQVNRNYIYFTTVIDGQDLFKNT